MSWTSAIYQLADAGSPALRMMGAADDLLLKASAKAVGGGQLDDAERFVATVGEARDMFRAAIVTARDGATPDAAAAAFSGLSEKLDVARGLGTGGSAQGPVRSAFAAARDVSDAIAGGATATGAIPDSTHMKLWDLRNSLDLAWNEIGISRVLGTLG